MALPRSTTSRVTVFSPITQVLYGFPRSSITKPSTPVPLHFQLFKTSTSSEPWQLRVAKPSAWPFTTEWKGEITQIQYLTLTGRSFTRGAAFFFLFIQALFVSCNFITASERLLLSSSLTMWPSQPRSRLLRKRYTSRSPPANDLGLRFLVHSLLPFFIARSVSSSYLRSTIFFY